MPRINDQLEIDDRELRFRTSRAGGPGGQHVNKTDTRVELVFDVQRSPSLREFQRRRIQDKLANRIAADGTLTVAAQDSRSQTRNREVAVERFAKLIRQALHVPKQRRETRPSKAAKRRRMDAKSRRSKVKKLRGRVED